jgi:hypothetical protein
MDMKGAQLLQIHLNFSGSTSMAQAAELLQQQQLRHVLVTVFPT